MSHLWNSSPMAFSLVKNKSPYPALHYPGLTPSFTSLWVSSLSLCSSQTITLAVSQVCQASFCLRVFALAFLFLEGMFLDTCLVQFLTCFMSLFKCHLINKAFSDPSITTMSWSSSILNLFILFIHNIYHNLIYFKIICLPQLKCSGVSLRARTLIFIHWCILRHEDRSRGGEIWDFTLLGS